MPETGVLPAPPSSAPAAFSDVMPLVRPPPSGSPAGTVGTGYGAPMGSLAPAILPKSTVTAGGTTAGTASALTTPIAVIVGATVGGGVILRGIAHDTQTLLNASGQAVLVYPPSGGTLNGGAGGIALNAGAQVDVHSVDGINYYAAS